MGCNEAGQELTLAAADTFEGMRKLRPLVPRPFLFPTSKVNSTCPLLHAPDIFSLHHHHYGEQENTTNKNETGTHQVVVSSRWNPTPEQLRALEELYRCGTRTPSAEQIQHITAQLRRYGKIEGKNVFYWFQNHKARERQKRRREIQLAAAGTTYCREHDTLDMTTITDKVSGANSVSQGVEENKNLMSWVPSTNSDDLAQDGDMDAPPVRGIEKEGYTNISSAETTQAPNREFQHHHHHTSNTNILSDPTKRTATWQLLKQPSSITSNLSLLSANDDTYYNLNHHYCPISLPLTTSFIPPLSLSPKSLDLNYLHEEIERKSLTLELLPLVKADGAHDVPMIDDGEATMEYNTYPYYKFL